MMCEFRRKIKRWKNGCSIKCLHDEYRKTIISWNRESSDWELQLMLCRGCPENKSHPYKPLSVSLHSSHKKESE